ncbi:hypothetical protein E3E36_04020 [Thermococcus sp. M36]|uniref:hypothetical protein n=1 Tax=Thermococcus sp. M36 TaxID=1638261 RepID=UPI00143C98DB|nr:hypothetical protein [Thermococcus sp. M36]NJE05319.1 hypothetical protein [Thermococcus sp. M36]
MEKMPHIGTEFGAFWAMWVIGLTATAWIILDIIVRQKTMSRGEKTVWALAAILLNLPVVPVIAGSIGKLCLALVYYLVSRKGGKTK